MSCGRVLDVVCRRRLDADLDAQLACHVDALEAEFLAKGLAPDEARSAARRAIGGLTQVNEAYRDQLRIRARDPFLMTLAATILVLVALLASGIPARRAAGIDRAVVLRAD